MEDTSLKTKLARRETIGQIALFGAAALIGLPLLNFIILPFLTSLFATAAAAGLGLLFLIAVALPLVFTVMNLPAIYRFMKVMNHKLINKAIATEPIGHMEEVKREKEADLARANESYLRVVEEEKLLQKKEAQLIEAVERSERQARGAKRGTKEYEMVADDLMSNRDLLKQTQAALTKIRSDKAQLKEAGEHCEIAIRKLEQRIRKAAELKRIAEARLASSNAMRGVLENSSEQEEILRIAMESIDETDAQADTAGEQLDQAMERPRFERKLERLEGDAIMDELQNAMRGAHGSTNVRVAPTEAQAPVDDVEEALCATDEEGVRADASNPRRR